MEQHWSFLAILFLSYFIYSCFWIIANIYYLGNQRQAIANMKQKEKSSTEGIYYIIPLLNEQARVSKLIQNFKKLNQENDQSKLVLVTTEREYVKSKHGSSTIDIINALLLKPEFKNWLIHLHYPHINNVVAKQLNFAIEELKKYNPNYIAFYNADSILDKELSELIFMTNKDSLFQQSSLFTSNLSNLVSRNQILTIAFAIYQSIWTIKTEITRFRLNNYTLRVGHTRPKRLKDI